MVRKGLTDWVNRYPKVRECNRYRSKGSAYQAEGVTRTPHCGSMTWHFQKQQRSEWVEKCEGEEWEMGFGEMAGSPDITALEVFVRTLLIKRGKEHYCEGVGLRSNNS